MVVSGGWHTRPNSLLPNPTTARLSGTLMRRRWHSYSAPPASSSEAHTSASSSGQASKNSGSCCAPVLKLAGCAALITRWLLIASVVMGGLLAIPMAVARVSSLRWVRFPVWLYTYVFRGTPLYVQLLVFYSGMYSLEIVRGTEFLNAFFRSGLNCTILALTLNTCAYTTEIFAGAIRAVPHGEIEAANAYGFSRFKMYRCIILPSALRTALPAYSNEVILMLHSTALAFTATVPDLLKIARDINAATYQPFYAFGIAAVLYLIISYVLISLFRKAEKRWMAHVSH